VAWKSFIGRSAVALVSGNVSVLRTAIGLRAEVLGVGIEVVPSDGAATLIFVGSASWSASS
jgi:hypothetical protein